MRAKAPVLRRSPASRQEPGQAGARRDQTTRQPRSIGTSATYALSDSYCSVAVKREGEPLLASSPGSRRSKSLPERDDSLLLEGRRRAGGVRQRRLWHGRRLRPVWQWAARAAHAAWTRRTVAQFEAALRRTHAEPDSGAGHRSDAASACSTASRLGKPNYDDMSRCLRSAHAQRQLPKFMALATSNWARCSRMKFAGVERQGWDIYEVQRTNGRFQDASSSAATARSPAISIQRQP